jgi:hypothetical protein
MVRPVVTDMVNGLLAVWPAESRNCAVKLNVPVLPGTPAISPVLEFNASPVGRVPLTTLQVYGAMPSVPVRNCEYAEPTTPLATIELTIPGGPVMVSPKPLLAVLPALSVTVAGVPIFNRTVGVPLTTPVVGFTDRPANDKSHDHAYGGVPPVAVRVYE